jgi:hypothetical protein
MTNVTVSSLTAIFSIRPRAETCPLRARQEIGGRFLYPTVNPAPPALQIGGQKTLRPTAYRGQPMDQQESTALHSP